jgi:putative tricarboxylic transport membrane protein
MRRSIRMLLGVLLLAIVVPVTASAQGDVKAKLRALKPADYPTQPIEFVVVYPAGGGMDVTARLLAKYVERYIEHRVIVVNKTGAAGLIGHTYLATSAKNDGYTVGIIGHPFLADQEMIRAKGKWSYKDLTPLNYINEDPVTWAVLTDGPFKDKSVKEIVALAKEKPATVRVSMAPDGSFQFLAEAVEMGTGAKLVKVPFQGGAPGVTAMLGGHVDVATAYYAEYRGHLEAGKVKIVAVASEKRSPHFPNVPTFDEALGTHGLVWIGWRYAAVPKGVAADRGKYLQAAIDVALHDKELIEEYRKMGVDAGKTLTAAETSAQVDRFYVEHKEFLTKTGRIGK